MSLNPEHLITFAQVAADGSVSAAANSLHRSQPAISLQLKQLQETVGEPLYTRHRYGITLTDTGKALLPYAQTISRTLTGATAIINDLKGLESGRLRIAASMTVAVYLLPALLAGFRERAPKLELHLLTRNSLEAVTLLQAGEADLCFVEGPVDAVPGGFFAKLFYEDEIVLVTSANHPLADVPSVSTEDLNGIDVVSREAGSGTREVVERALAHLGIHVNTVLNATGLEAVKEGVLHGLGAAFLSKLALGRELESGLLRVVPIKGVRLIRPMTLLRPDASMMSMATRAFLAYLENADDLVFHET